MTSTIEFVACRFCRHHPEAIGSTSGLAVLQHRCEQRQDFVTMTGRREDIAAWWNGVNAPEQVAA